MGMLIAVGMCAGLYSCGSRTSIRMGADGERGEDCASFWTCARFGELWFGACGEGKVGWGEAHVFEVVYLATLPLGSGS